MLRVGESESIGAAGEGEASSRRSSKLGRVVSCRHGMALLLAAVLVIGLLRGIAFPHRWAATHAFFRYGSQGFIKRGLVGTVLGALGEVGNRYATFFGLSLLVFTAICLVLLRLLADATEDSDPLAPVAGLVFATSIGPMYIGCTMGYFEQLAWLACLGLLPIQSFNRRLAMMALCFGSLLFVHEGVFLMALPVAVAACLLARDFCWSRGQVACLLAVGLVLVSLTIYIGNATIARRQALLLFRDSQSLSDIVLKRNAFDVLARDGFHNMRIMLRLAKRATHWQELSYGFLVSLPSAFLLAAIGWRSLCQLGIDRGRRMLVAAASFSPLLLHFLAWDIHRWNAMAITNGFVVYGFVLRAKSQGVAGKGPGWVHALPSWVASSDGDTQGRVAKEGSIAKEEGVAKEGASVPTRMRWLAAAGLLVALLNNASSVPMISGAKPEPFPFRTHWAYLSGVVLGKRSFPRVKRNPAIAKAKAKDKGGSKSTKR